MVSCDGRVDTDIHTSDIRAHLDSGRVDIVFLEDGEGLLEEFAADADGGQVRGVVVVKAIDIFHDSGLVGLHRREDEQVL